MSPSTSVSVIFHLSAPEDWERASRSGVYTAASLHDHGFIGCATAAQHAAVANARFAGRGELVLLLIDTRPALVPAALRADRCRPEGLPARVRPD